MIDILQDLNEKQKESVMHHTGPLLVRAGPGTGKTKVITHRIAHLISEHQVNPENILAITFTDKASQVMKDRLSDEELIEEYNSIQVKVFTFHAFCQSVLREHAPKIGLSKNFMVCNDEIQEEILTECLHELKLINLNNIFKRLQWLSQDISYFKARIHDPLAPTSFSNSLKGASAKNLEYVSNCEDIFNTYQHKLEEQNLIDFDDLLLKTVELFENVPTVQETYQTDIHYTLVDEYQDVNSTQYRILQLLCATPKQNIMVVADEDQAIYGWRGADALYIKKFKMDFNPKIVELDKHYRCTETILRSAERVIAKNTSITKRVLPKTTPNTEPDRKIWHYSTQNASKESDLIISQLIRQLKDKLEYSYGQIAILYRKHKSADDLAVKLLETGIQFQRVQPTNSFQNRNRQGIISYLSIFLEKHIRNNSVPTITPDDLELAINYPQKRIDDLTWARLKWLARREGIELIDLLKNIEAYSKDVGPLTRRNVNQFWKQIEQLSTEIQGEEINPIVQRLLAVLNNSQCPYKREEVEILENQLDVPHLPTTIDLLYKAINHGERIQIITYYGIDEYCASHIIRQTLNTYLKQDISIQFLSPDINKLVLDTDSLYILIGSFEELNINTVKGKAILIGTQSTKQTNLVQLETNSIQSITALKLCQSLVERFESLSIPDLVIYDLETRGADIGKAEIVEIAAYRINSKSGEIRKYHQLVKPPQGKLPKSNLHVHGITEEMVKDSPSIKDVLPDFLKHIQDCILIGHNIIEFDNLILNRNLEKYCGVKLTNLCYDTLTTARRLYPRKPASLEVLAEHFDIEHGALHRAEEDVIVTHKVFRELAKKDSQRRRISSLTELLPFVGYAILDKTEGLSNNETSTENRVFLNAATRFVQIHYSQGESNLANSMPFKSREKEKIETFINKLRNREVSDFPEDTNWKIHCAEFRNAVNDFKKESKTGLVTDFLTYHKQIKNIDDIEEDDDQLTLMTLHASKGTEYPIVIIIGMEEDTSQMEEEERRLFYVGMTRAQMGLYFTSIFHSDGRSSSPPLFSEIPTDYIKRWPE